MTFREYSLPGAGRRRIRDSRADITPLENVHPRLPATFLDLFLEHSTDGFAFMIAPTHWIGLRDFGNGTRAILKRATLNCRISPAASPTA